MRRPAELSGQKSLSHQNRFRFDCNQRMRASILDSRSIVLLPSGSSVAVISPLAPSFHRSERDCKGNVLPNKHLELPKVSAASLTVRRLPLLSARI